MGNESLSLYKSCKLVERLPDNRILFFEKEIERGKKFFFYACLYSKDEQKILWSAFEKEKNALCDRVLLLIEILYGDIFFGHTQVDRFLLQKYSEGELEL